MENTSKITESLLSLLNKEAEIISKRYNFLSLKEEDIQKIILETTKEIITTNQNIEEIRQLFRIIFEDKLQKIARNLLDKEESYEIITAKTSLTMDEISNFMEQYNALLLPSVAKKLISTSDKLKEEIKNYIDKKTNSQTSNPISNITNETYMILIDSYAELENISLNFEIEADENAELLQNYDGLKIMLKTSLKEKLLTKDEEYDLFLKAQNGDQKAREKLIMANLQLVVSIAKSFKTLPLEDAIQEGIIGLITAIDKFDISKKYRLSTYATTWIKVKIKRAIINNQLIKISPSTYYDIKAIQRIQNEYQLYNGTTPTITELLNISNVPLKTIKSAIINNNYISLNSKMSDDGDRELQDFIPDPDIDIIKEYESKELVEFVINELNKNNLNSETIEMLKLKIGYNNDRSYTYQEIAKMYNTTEQNVHRKIKAILKKIQEILSDDYNGYLISTSNRNLLVFKKKIKEYYPLLINKLPEEELNIIDKFYRNRISDLKKSEIEYLLRIIIPKVNLILNEIVPSNKDNKTTPTVFEILSIYDCNEEIVLNGISYLPEEYKEILQRRNGIFQ